MANLEKDMILLESNHDIEMLADRKISMASVQRILDRGIFAMKSGQIGSSGNNAVQSGLLGHLSQENNFPELAYRTVCNALLEKRSTLKRCISGSCLRDRM